MKITLVHCLLVVTVVACVGTGVWYLLPLRTSGLSPVELAELALHAPTVTEQTEAVVQLADFGEEALAALRRVLDETTQPDVQSACLEGLGRLWDYDSMERILDLAESGPPRVRGRAAQVVMRMTGRLRRYESNAPEAKRRVLVQYMRQDWDEIQRASDEDRNELKRRLRESHEKKS